MKCYVQVTLPDKTLTCLPIRRIDFLEMWIWRYKKRNIQKARKKKITKKFWSGGIWRMKYWKKHLRTVEINCWHHMNLNWQKKWTLPQRIDISDLIRVARAGYSRNICICPALIRSDRASPDRHRRSSLFISLAFILSLVKSDVVEKTGTVGKLEKSLPVWVW